MNEATLTPFSSFSERRSESALARELPYWDFEEDVAVLTDGTLALGANLRGIAIETLDTSDINRLTMDLRALLNGLPDGCEISFVSEVSSDYETLLSGHHALRGKRESLSSLTDARVDTLAKETRAGNLFRPKLYCFVYRRFDGLKSKKGLSLLSAPSQFIAATRDHYDAALKELRQVSRTVFGSLEAAGLRVSAMTGKELRRLVYQFLNPSRARSIGVPAPSDAHRDQEFHPAERAMIPALNAPSPRQQLVFSDLICQVDKLHSDGLFHRCVTLKTMPESTYAALISRLSELPFRHTLHVHLKVPEQSKELAGLQAKRRMAHSMALSHNGRANDLESEAKLHSTEELLRELLTTGQKLFYFQCVVYFSAETPDELESQARATLAKFRELNGAEAIAETVANLKVWKTILPAGNTTMVRPKRVKTDNLADFLPLYQPYDGGGDGKPVCVFRNRYSGLIQYDPFDPGLPNYNALVTGSSGAGKSFANNLILLQYATRAPLIYIIDVGGSYRKLCEYLGGQYVEIAPPNDAGPSRAINPFELAPGAKVPSPQKIKFLMAFLESVFTDDPSKHLGRLHRSLLEEAIIELYRSLPDRAPRLSDLMKQLGLSSEPALRDYGKMLYPWTGDRPYGRLLDGSDTFNLDSDTVVFDLKGLSSYPDLQSVMILIITDSILRRIETARDRNKRIYMDECWELLKNPASQSFMEYCVRTLRKTGSGITFITQGLEELIANPIGPAILSNTASKFVLLQRGSLEPVKQLLKLNDQELSLVASLGQQKGHYSEALMIANEARSVIRIEPMPLEYWIATSDAADNQLVEKRRANATGMPLQATLQELSHEYPFGVSGGRR